MTEELRPARYVPGPTLLAKDEAATRAAVRAANANSDRQFKEQLRGFTNELTKMILEPVQGQTQQPQTWWPGFISTVNSPGFMRSAEHIVSSLNPTAAASPHGVYDVPADSEWTGEFPETFISDAMPASKYANMLELEPGQKVPPLFRITSSAGKTVGEKQPVFSKAADIAKDDGTVINASNHVNVSGVVLEAGYWAVANLILKAAVAAEASSEIAKAVEAGAATTGWDHFTGGRYVPNVLVVPPAQVPNVKAADMQALGFQLVFDPSVTKVLIVDKSAVWGYLRKGNMDAMEPSTYGVGLTYNTYGRISVDPAGVSSIANPA